MTTKLSILALMTVTSIAFAATRPGPSYAPHGPSTLTSPHAALTEYSSEVEYDMAPMVVSAASTVTRLRSQPRHWACGPVESNLVGGSQRSCEWR